MIRNDLQKVVVEALKHYNNSASIIEICKYVWEHYQDQLKNSGDLFYTWQYDIRWAATQLREAKIMKAKEISPRGLWELV